MQFRVSDENYERETQRQRQREEGGREVERERETALKIIIVPQKYHDKCTKACSEVAFRPVVRLGDRARVGIALPRFNRYRRAV